MLVSIMVYEFVYVTAGSITVISISIPSCIPEIYQVIEEDQTDLNSKDYIR